MSVNPWMGRRVLHLAHRGGSLEGPENTLAAFRHGLDRGAHGIELDVRATVDGALVVIHDDDLDRVTDAHGRVAELPEDVVRAATVVGGPTPSDRPSDEPGDRQVPLLDDVLAAFPSAYIVLDIKSVQPKPYEQALAAVLQRHDRVDDVVVGSFHHAALERFRRAAPQVSTSLSPDETFALWSGAWSAPAHGSVHAVQVPRTYEDIDVVTTEFVDACHRQALALHVWTVDAPDEIRRLVDLGVDGIITDRPSVCAQVLGELGVTFDG